MLACVATFLSVGLRAARHARQARSQVVLGLEAAPYDLHSAPRWQRAAFLAAGVTALGLVAFQLVAEDCSTPITFLAGYGRCKDGAAIYHQAAPLNAMLMTFDLLLLGLLACAGIVRFLARVVPPLMMFIVRVRLAGIFLLMGATLALGLIGLLGELPLLTLGGLLTGTAGTALWAER